MPYRLCLVVALLGFAPAALATGQEMGALAAYLAVLVAVVAGLVISVPMAVFILHRAWRTGRLRERPARVAAICAGVLLAGPIVVLLAIILTATAMELGPGAYSRLTERPPDSPAPAPHAPPQTNLLSATRDRLVLLGQDITRWWYYDPDVEEAERRASESKVEEAERRAIEGN